MFALNTGNVSRRQTFPSLLVRGKRPVAVSLCFIPSLSGQIDRVLYENSENIDPAGPVSLPAAALSARSNLTGRRELVAFPGLDFDGAKNGPFERFNMNATFLPRHAWDKHRENSFKRPVLCRAACVCFQIMCETLLRSTV